LLSEIKYKSFRIKFEKIGAAKYISHLDLNRIFSRAIARADIKIAHSEGFNPHPKIAFVSALSLGTESFCEFVDMKIIDTDDVSESDIFNSLKDVFPSGINIKEVYIPQSDFKYIDRTRFYIFVKPTGFDADGLGRLFDSDVLFLSYSDKANNISYDYAKANEDEILEFFGMDDEYCSDFPEFLLAYCDEKDYQKLRGIWDSKDYILADDRMRGICELIGVKVLYEFDDVPDGYKTITTE